MTRELKVIDVSDLPDLLRVAEEVEKTREPRLLRRASKDLAIVVPAPRVPRSRRRKTLADYEAFLSSAGSWKDSVDTEQWIKDSYESRARSSRPAVNL
jgi:hypothetical protein